MNELPACLIRDAIESAAKLYDSVRHSSVTLAPVTPANCLLGTFAQNVIHYETGERINYPDGGAPPGALDVGPWEVKAVNGWALGLMVNLGLAKLYRPETQFVLVYCDPPRYEVRGWTLGSNFLGNERLIRRDIRDPAYLLPVQFLRPWPLSETKGTT